MIAAILKSKAFDFLCRHRLWLLGAVAVLCFADVAAVTIGYLVYPGYLDHGEPSVALISWRLLEGFPAYPAFDEPDRTTNLYGPVTYLIHAASYFLAGPGIPVSKAAGLAAALMIPAVVFATHRRWGAYTAATASILGAGFIVLGLPMTIWNRPEPLLALFVALAVWAMNASREGEPEWGKSAIIAVCGGLAVGLKIHAGIYFVPLVLYHSWGRGSGTFLFICFVGAVTAVAPFAWEIFSLSNFLTWFPHMAGKPTDLSMLTKILRYSVFYLAPVLFFLAARKWRNGALGTVENVYFGSFIVCVLLSLVPAAKPGAGWYYLFPFLALSVDMILRFSGAVTINRWPVWAGVGVVAAAMFIVSVPIQKRFFRALHWQKADDITADIDAILKSYPGKTIQMGMGDSIAGYNNTLFKPLLVFAGHPHTLDIGIAIETSKLGIPLPQGTLDRIENCHTDAWLIPTGEKPFSMIGYYRNPVFGDSFRSAFHRVYTLQKRFQFFDVWTCRK